MSVKIDGIVGFCPSIIPECLRNGNTVLPLYLEMNDLEVWAEQHDVMITHNRFTGEVSLWFDVKGGKFRQR